MLMPQTHPLSQFVLPRRDVIDGLLFSTEIGRTDPQ
jgi:hypothetical protein